MEFFIIFFKIIEKLIFIAFNDIIMVIIFRGVI